MKQIKTTLGKLRILSLNLCEEAEDIILLHGAPKRVLSKKSFLSDTLADHTETTLETILITFLLDRKISLEQVLQDFHGEIEGLGRSIIGREKIDSVPITITRDSILAVILYCPSLNKSSVLESILGGLKQKECLQCDKIIDNFWAYADAKYLKKPRSRGKIQYVTEVGTFNHTWKYIDRNLISSFTNIASWARPVALSHVLSDEEAAQAIFELLQAAYRLNLI